MFRSASGYGFSDKELENLKINYGVYYKQGEAYGLLKSNEGVIILVYVGGVLYKTDVCLYGEEIDQLIKALKDIKRILR